MAAIRSVLRTSLSRNSLLQASRCLVLRSLSTHVDDYVTGITDHQKQVGFVLISGHQESHTNVLGCVTFLDPRSFLSFVVIR